MNCKNCNARLPEGEAVCPNCGFHNKTVWKRVLAFACAAILLSVLVCTALYALGVADFGLKENNAQYKSSYTVSDKKVLKKSNTVIATVGDRKLTNELLQIYYSIEVVEFITNYSNYLGYFGLDYTKPLDEQYFSAADKITWQQKFLDGALNTWYMYAIMDLTAKEEGYVYDQELIKSIENLPNHLKELAEKNKYSSAQEMIEADFGAACTAEAYLQYLSEYYKGVAFLSSKYDTMTPTQQEIDTYFAENQKELEQNGIKKTSGKYVDVRHILIEPQGGKEDEKGNVTYSQEEWDKCGAEAQAILDEWLAGEATETSFGELANKYSKDPGSNTKGSLYEQVAAGKMVEEFDAWIFDESRVPGHYGLVKTEFGYHVMYYVGSEDIWICEVRNMILSDRTDAYIQQVQKSLPLEVTYKNIVLGQLVLE